MITKGMESKIVTRGPAILPTKEGRNREMVGINWSYDSLQAAPSKVQRVSVDCRELPQLMSPLDSGTPQTRPTH